MPKNALKLVRGEGLSVEAAAEYLATARNVDDIKEVHDQAKAIEAYHHRRGIAHNLELDAGEIAIRAERRLGELCKEVTGGKGGDRKSKVRTTVDLADLDITHNQSKRWQKLAKVTPKRFDKAIETTREHGRVTAAGVLREATPAREAREAEWHHMTAHVRLWNVLEKEIEAWDRGGELNELRIVLSLATLQCEQLIKHKGGKK